MKLLGSKIDIVTLDTFNWHDSGNCVTRTLLLLFDV